MPPALLAAAYMATSAQKDVLDAQESPPLPGPWTLMTVRVPPAVTTSRAMALPGTMSTMSRTSSAANTSARGQSRARRAPLPLTLPVHPPPGMHDTHGDATDSPSAPCLGGPAGRSPARGSGWHPRLS